MGPRLGRGGTLVQVILSGGWGILVQVILYEGILVHTIPSRGYPVPGPPVLGEGEEQQEGGILVQNVWEGGTLVQVTLPTPLAGVCSSMIRTGAVVGIAS